MKIISNLPATIHYKSNEFYKQPQQLRTSLMPMKLLRKCMCSERYSFSCSQHLLVERKQFFNGCFDNKRLQAAN